MEPNVKKEAQEVLLWQNKLADYSALFSIEPDKKQLELNIIKQSLKLLSRKITFGIIGPVKAGKSTFINALLGASILTAEAMACTFFATKIRFSEKIRFYDEKDPENCLEDLDAIKKKIKSLNDSKRIEFQKANN